MFNITYINTKWEHFKDKYIKKYIPSYELVQEPADTIGDLDATNDYIYSLLNSSKPCMISRYGDSELGCAINYVRGRHPFWFLRTIFPFWVLPYVSKHICNNAGFFPNSNKYFSKYSDRLVSSAKEVDLLGSCLGSWERFFEPLCHYKKCKIDYTHPFFAKRPWSRVLKGKKVLVVHPFSETIRKQYQRRELLFDNPDILPEFSSLRIVKAIQSMGGENNGFNNWFEALEYMEREIDKEDYDVAIIGCGAYGMPLAAHCKQMGKKAIHLGGALQLLFGIAGNRWLNDFGEDYHKLCSNPYWVRPSQSERPKNADSVEDACYW